MARTNFFALADKELEQHASKQQQSAPADPGAGGTGGNTPPQQEQQPAPAGGAETTKPAPTTTTTTTTSGSGSASQPGAGATGGGTPPQQEQQPAPEGQQQAPPAGESEEEIARRVLKARGIDVDNFDDLVSRVNNQPLSEDEQKKLAARREQAAIKAFMEGGGTLDEYHRQKTLRTADDALLVMNDFRAKLKTLNPKITDQEIEEQFKTRYFIGEEGDYEEWQTKLGQERLKEAAGLIRNRETASLSKVEQQLIDTEKADTQRRAWENKVQNYVQSMPKSFTLPIGKFGDKDLGDFSYNLSEEEQRDIVSDLKDPQTLLKLITDEKTGGTDLNKLRDLLMWKRLGERIIRTASNEFHSKGIEEITSKLENWPNLNNRPNTTATTPEREIEEGKRAAAADASNILGKKHRAKSL